MATDEFILALDPEPVRQIVRMDRAKYEIVRQTILEILFLHGPLVITELGDRVEDQLQNDFDGPLMWYYRMVKLDMEACGQIHRVPESWPTMIEISN